MDPNSNQTLQEIYRLTRENNQMLHAMRRNALWGGILKAIFYAILFAAPIWFYMTYLSGTVDQLIATANQINGANQDAQVKISGFQDAIKNFQEHLPTFLQNEGSSSSSTAVQ